MKKLVSFLAATVLVATMMTTSSCTKTCDAGYEGSDCKTLVAAKYYGNTWVINGHDDQTPQSTYTNRDLTIATGSATNVLTLSFSSINLGWVLTGTLSSDGKTFNFDQKTIGTSTYSGSGSFTDSKNANISLTEVDASVSPSKTYVYTLTATRP